MHGSIGGRWQRRDDDAGAAGPRPAAGTRRHHGLVGTSTATTIRSEPAPYLTDVAGWGGSRIHEKGLLSWDDDGVRSHIVDQPGRHFQ